MSKIWIKMKAAFGRDGALRTNHKRDKRRHCAQQPPSLRELYFDLIKRNNNNCCAVACNENCL